MMVVIAKAVGDSRTYIVAKDDSPASEQVGKVIDLDVKEAESSELPIVAILSRGYWTDDIGPLTDEEREDLKRLSGHIG